MIQCTHFPRLCAALTLVIAAALGSARAAQAELIYFDAAPSSNTFTSSGATITLGSATAANWTDNLWALRTDSGFNNTRLEAAPEEKVPVLRLTASGLAPNAPIDDVRLYFTSATTAPHDWGFVYSFNFADVAADGMSLAGTEVRRTSAGSEFVENISSNYNRYAYTVDLTGLNLSTDQDGKVSVYFDTRNNITGNAYRASFDGMAVSVVPEPATSVALLTAVLGLLFCAWRKRK